MATKKRMPYAWVRSEYNWSSGYGHVFAHVYDLFGYVDGTLKISCQAGGTSDSTESYAWQHGVSNDYSILGLQSLKLGYKLMRAVERSLTKSKEEHGDPRDFADYMIRVLLGAGVKKVHVTEKVNGTLSVTEKIEDLPYYHPVRQHDDLHSVIKKMEAEVIRLTAR